MNKHKQLTYEQRCQIEALKKSGMSQLAMARSIGVSQPTISRELKRNSGQRTGITGTGTLEILGQALNGNYWDRHSTEGITGTGTQLWKHERNILKYFGTGTKMFSNVDRN